MGGGLRPPPTVDLSIDVNIDLVVIVGTLVAVAIAVATVDLVGCTGAWVFRQLQLAAYRDLGCRGQTGCGLDLGLLGGLRVGARYPSIPDIANSQLNPTIGFMGRKMTGSQRASELYILYNI